MGRQTLELGQGQKPGSYHDPGPNSALGNSFVRHNTQQLTRVYPMGLRMNSANYNPQEMWNTGCQLGELGYKQGILGRDGHFSSE